MDYGLREERTCEKKTLSNRKNEIKKKVSKYIIKETLRKSKKESKSINVLFCPAF